jgi:prefoldin subunit 5
MRTIQEIDDEEFNEELDAAIEAMKQAIEAVKRAHPKLINTIADMERVLVTLECMRADD